jgi:hypothetical protein
MTDAERITYLESLLKPFAAFADRFKDRPGACPVDIVVGGDLELLNVDDLRNAATALARGTSWSVNPTKRMIRTFWPDRLENLRLWQKRSAVVSNGIAWKNVAPDAASGGTMKPVHHRCSKLPPNPALLRGIEMLKLGRGGAALSFQNDEIEALLSALMGSSR